MPAATEGAVIYELRQYRIKLDRIEDCHRMFREVMVPLFGRLGARPARLLGAPEPGRVRPQRRDRVRECRGARTHLGRVHRWSRLAGRDRPLGRRPALREGQFDNGDARGRFVHSIFLPCYSWKAGNGVRPTGWTD
jgi:hypothetical protein